MESEIFYLRLETWNWTKLRWWRQSYSAEAWRRECSCLDFIIFWVESKIPSDGPKPKLYN